MRPTDTTGSGRLLKNGSGTRFGARRRGAVAIEGDNGKPANKAYTAAPLQKCDTCLFQQPVGSTNRWSAPAGLQSSEIASIANESEDAGAPEDQAASGPGRFGESGVLHIVGASESPSPKQQWAHPCPKRTFSSPEFFSFALPRQFDFIREIRKKDRSLSRHGTLEDVKGIGGKVTVSQTMLHTTSP